MEPDHRQQAFLFSNIASQLRGALSNLHLAAAQLVPAQAREQDPELDAKAALLDQSYYQLLRLVNNLSAAAVYLGSDKPLPLQDRDIVDAVRELCAQAGVTLTPAGAAFPGGVDPEDSVIRIAPSYPPLTELAQVMELFPVAVKLAALEAGYHLPD